MGLQPTGSNFHALLDRVSIDRPDPAHLERLCELLPRVPLFGTGLPIVASDHSYLMVAYEDAKGDRSLRTLQEILPRLLEEGVGLLVFNRKNEPAKLVLTLGDLWDLSATGRLMPDCLVQLQGREVSRAIVGHRDLAAVKPTRAMILSRVEPGAFPSSVARALDEYLSTAFELPGSSIADATLTGRQKAAAAFCIAIDPDAYQRQDQFELLTSLSWFFRTGTALSLAPNSNGPSFTPLRRLAEPGESLGDPSNEPIGER